MADSRQKRAKGGFWLTKKAFRDPVREACKTLVERPPN